MLYVAVKHLHIICVILSITGFCLRAWMKWQKSALVLRSNGQQDEPRWLRILPHVNDTILLVAALTLTVLIGQYPFIDAWLTAKIFGLIAYIILGALALQAGRTAWVRWGAGVLAIVVFSWIVSVALKKNPLGWLA